MSGVSDGRVKLPGFGLSLKEMPERTTKDAVAKGGASTDIRLPHAIADWCESSGVTVYERNMLDFMSQITDKPSWDDKVFDERIVNKWLQETAQYQDFTDAMFDYCIKELREKAQKFKETGMVAVMDTEATVVKSDCAVPSELRDALRAAAFRLEDVPDHRKDWHPGSDHKVLDLLHPSLFPLVYGRTRVLPTGRVPLATCSEHSGEGELTEPVEISEDTTTIMERIALSSGDNDRDCRADWDEFQWLPSDVHFKDGGGVEIASYVNNLHPAHHEDLYRVLEQMVDRSIPLWNEAISWFQDRIRIKIEATSDEDYCRPEGAQSPAREIPADWDEEKHGKYHEMFDPRYQERYEEWFESVKVVAIPKPGPYRPFPETTSLPGAYPIDLRERFKDRGLQIIFKLANIHLTPDKPEYEGGTWHVEGALNEHICATALYYYDQENITDSHLSFRQSIAEEDMIMRPHQDQYSSCEAYYGIRHNEPGSLVQVLGSVATRTGRLLVFPNVLQHRVSPFRLADLSRPGHRKILAMFLVDPHVRVISTANVPPQRRDWWAEELRRTVPRLAALPPEIFDRVISEVEEPWGFEEARRIRRGLMDRRGAMNDEVNNYMMELLRTLVSYKAAIMNDNMESVLIGENLRLWPRGVHNG
ncbi:hypothetical protein DL766_009449 [Monosporascus sp. MC13-8B]|uniref:Uncharacterized protein n=1 Tax=Monosporascus cannonballus TaxID=155416 RepID=A0ABY0HCH5_9PEZI|nr:hypothetical protein DL762_004373 [Monosporascus cannonballus]RYO91030.1 hypothetical protein DL763_005108 [Monosporascus cannonballus]RYP15238.1 hypothetical protein DL766_009449 [Monosporascus sp. MC13-8B]